MEAPHCEYCRSQNVAFDLLLNWGRDPTTWEVRDEKLVRTDDPKSTYYDNLILIKEFLKDSDQYDVMMVCGKCMDETEIIYKGQSGFNAVKQMCYDTLAENRNDLIEIMLS